MARVEVKRESVVRERGWSAGGMVDCSGGYEVCIEGVVCVCSRVLAHAETWKSMGGSYGDRQRCNWNASTSI